jgi:hypothetical protein
MESEEFETESSHGTVTSVDLLRQDPTEESAEPKPSVASPEEEKLATGVSAIGLKIKRLSGAQRRKLNREKKKKEGTWMERKPPSKYPKSGARSDAGSIGSVKRPHSDSSKPTMKRQHSKKPRSAVAQTGSYTEAVAGIKMAVIDKRHPEVKLDQTQAEIIQAKLVAAVHAHPVEETPLRYLNSKFLHE